MADAEAVDFHQRKKDAHYGAVDPDASEARAAVATPAAPAAIRWSVDRKRIADEIVKIHALGFSGATLSFVNFNEEIAVFFVDARAAVAAASGPCARTAYR